VGTINGWTVQVYNELVYFAAADGVWVYGDTNIAASSEDRRLQVQPNVVRISSEIDTYWGDNFTIPDPYKVEEVSKGGYADYCSTLSYTTGGDASNFKADDVGIEPNDYIIGGTSKAVAKVVAVDLDSGTWTGGDAAGTLYLSEVSCEP